MNHCGTHTDNRSESQRCMLYGSCLQDEGAYNCWQLN